MTRLYTSTLTLCVLLTLTGAALAYIPKTYSFPDLVANSAVIANGVVSIQGEKPVLAVEKLLKGNAGRRLTLLSRAEWVYEPAGFKDGERVLVFLKRVDDDGAATLLGLSDMGKWPQTFGGFHTDTYRTASVAELTNTVSTIMGILAEKDVDKLAESVIGMLAGKKDLERLAALDLVSSQAYTKAVTSQKMSRQRQVIAAHSLDALRSKNPDVRAAAIGLSTYAPTSLVTDRLIELLTDSDKGCQNRARTALDAVFSYAKIAEPRPVLLPLDTKEQRATAKVACEKAWNARKDQQREADIAALQAKAESETASKLEKDSAVLYLRRLGVAP